MDDIFYPARGFILAVAITLVGVMVFGLLQPRTAQCEDTIIVGLNKDITVEDAAYMAEVKSPDGEISIVNISPEDYYSLNVGDGVQTCTSVGVWVETSYSQWIEKP
jgi:hypothetical protein